MCMMRQPPTPKVVIPAVKRMSASPSEAAQRSADFERLLRRSNAPMADILTSPLGVLGDANDMGVLGGVQ